MYLCKYYLMYIYTYFIDLNALEETKRIIEKVAKYAG